MIIYLHRGHGFFSACIRWQTRSDYTHASILLDSGELVEAVGGGVRVLAGGLPAREDADAFHVETSTAQAARMSVWLLTQLGKPYDRTMVLRFLTREQETRKSKGKWFCSELVFAAFQREGIELLARTQPWEVSPGLLAKSPLLTRNKELDSRPDAWRPAPRIPRPEDTEPFKHTLDWPEQTEALICRGPLCPVCYPLSETGN